MHRDGKTVSLWQDGSPDFETKSPFIPERRYDVVVVGGGLTGMTTALLLQRAGKSCIVFEARNPGFGTTGGTTAHLTTALDRSYDEIERNFSDETARLLSRATRDAFAIVKENVWNHQISCGFQELPAFVLAGSDSEASALESIVESTRKVGIPVEYVDQIPIARDFKKAAVFSRQAQFHPVKYLYGLANAFEELGGVVIPNARVLGAREGETIQVETTRGAIIAKSLIYATHTPPGLNVLHTRIAPYRSYVIAARLRGQGERGEYPEALIYDMEDPYHYYRTHEVNGEKFLIVGGEDHKTGHGQPEEAFAKLEVHARGIFDVESIAYRWSSQLYESADGLPFIGQMPQHRENVFVATGFGGNGMICGTMSALVLRDILVRGRSDYEDIFDPNRVKPMAGLTTYLKENADVVGKLVQGWMPRSKLGDVSDLGPGEGRVVNYEGKSIALHRDEQGRIQAVNPTCPHAKCRVGFNPVEQSWDCPCHGSRFAVGGEMLNGPTSRGLEKVEIRGEAERRGEQGA